MRTILLPVLLIQMDYRYFNSAWAAVLLPLLAADHDRRESIHSPLAGLRALAGPTPMV